MPQRERVKQFVQFLFRAAYKQLIRFANVSPFRWIAALDKQDERLEKIITTSKESILSKPKTAKKEE